MPLTVSQLLESPDARLYEVRTHGPGPVGKLPFTEQMLLDSPARVRRRRRNGTVHRVGCFAIASVAD